MFLLEYVKLDQFKKVLNLAKNVLDEEEFAQISKIGHDYEEAIEGTAGMEETETKTSGATNSPGSNTELVSKLKGRKKANIPKVPAKAPL